MNETKMVVLLTYLNCQPNVIRSLGDWKLKLGIFLWQAGVEFFLGVAPVKKGLSMLSWHECYMTLTLSFTWTQNHPWQRPPWPPAGSIPGPGGCPTSSLPFSGSSCKTIHRWLICQCQWQSCLHLWHSKVVVVPSKAVVYYCQSFGKTLVHMAQRSVEENW